MFCPLCRSEYADTSRSCTSCAAELVSSREQAAAIGTEVVWRGEDDVLFQQIFWALRDQDIACTGQQPFRAQSLAALPKELLAKLPVARTMGAVRQALKDLIASRPPLEIRVLRSHYNAAREIARHIEAT